MKKYRGLLQLAAVAVMIALFPFADRLADTAGGWAMIFGVIGIAYLLATMGQDRYREGRKC